MYILIVAAICLICSKIALEHYISKNDFDFDEIVGLNILITICSLIWFATLPILVFLVIGKLIHKGITR